MSTITKEDVLSDLEEKLSAPYTLILWNDDFNTFDWVIECLMRVCKHQFEQASQCAHLVHFKGKCDVKRGDKELITEMYNKLKSANLTVTMESN
jgi:ATP-dependent Clp protease adaptor protein ClpS